MRYPLARHCAAILALSISTEMLSATVGDKADSGNVTSFQQSLTDGLKLQDDTAAAVAAGKENAETAILRVKGVDSPSGMKLTDHDGDFALAAIGIGNRLRGLDRTAEALKFFGEAERALVVAVAKISDTSPHEKAMLLQHLAYIRGFFLDKAAQAKKDFDAAIQLQPKDEWLQRLRDDFLSAHADLVTADANQSTK